MRNSLFKIYLFFLLISCHSTPIEVKAQTSQKYKFMVDESTNNGAERLNEYLPLIKGKRVGIVANHTSMVNNVHLVDTLLTLKINVVKVFAPEHGFRGMADAGEKVSTDTDEKTGLPCISLYGKNKKPTADQLADVDVVLFDIQDVGARFYTYISTMSYVMEACAENNKQIIVLDRPNPNGHYVDGPINKKTGSFVGLHPIPVVHGMTVGEYAMMVNGEKWLANGIQCNLKVITVEEYDHNSLYAVPIAPSPNLKTLGAIYLYPTTCLFEGTDLSVGRGTENPFIYIGHPDYNNYSFSFTPISMPGAKSPKFMDKKCFGIDFVNDSKWGIADDAEPLNKLQIGYVIELYKQFTNKDKFFTSFFDQLIGDPAIKQMIIDGKTDTEIKNSWKKETDDFKVIRKKYLLYKDFE